MHKMTIEDAITRVNKETPRYAIVGAKYDGFRGIPTTYKLVSLMASDDLELQSICSGLEFYKVYDLSASKYSMSDFKEIFKKKINTATEENERKLLKKLLDKYPD